MGHRRTIEVSVLNPLLRPRCRLLPSRARCEFSIVLRGNRPVDRLRQRDQRTLGLHRSGGQQNRPREGNQRGLGQGTSRKEQHHLPGGFGQKLDKYQPVVQEGGRVTNFNPKELWERGDRWETNEQGPGRQDSIKTLKRT